MRDLLWITLEPLNRGNCELSYRIGRAIGKLGEYCRISYRFLGCCVPLAQLKLTDNVCDDYF
jgi:hypothetical protein